MTMNSVVSKPLSEYSLEELDKLQRASSMALAPQLPFSARGYKAHYSGIFTNPLPFAEVALAGPATASTGETRAPGTLAGYRGPVPLPERGALFGAYLRPGEHYGPDRRTSLLTFEDMIGRPLAVERGSVPNCGTECPLGGDMRALASLCATLVLTGCAGSGRASDRTRARHGRPSRSTGYDRARPPWCSDRAGRCRAPSCRRGEAQRHVAGGVQQIDLDVAVDEGGEGEVHRALLAHLDRLVRGRPYRDELPDAAVTDAVRASLLRAPVEVAVSRPQPHRSPAG